MKMFYLLKKEILLAGNYFWFSLACVIGVMVFFSNQESPRFSSIYTLFIAVSFSCYFLFSNIFAMEDKYKGNLYLMAIPYRKRNIIGAKYLLAILIYIFALCCYQVMFFIKIPGITLVKYKLTFSCAAIVFLITSIILSVFFALYYCFSYRKIKAALIVVMVFIPTWGLIGLNRLTNLNIIYYTPKVSTIPLIILVLLSMIIMRVSVEISFYFLKKRNL